MEASTTRALFSHPEERSRPRQRRGKSRIRLSRATWSRSTVVGAIRRYYCQRRCANGSPSSADSSRPIGRDVHPLAVLTATRSCERCLRLESTCDHRCRRPGRRSNCVVVELLGPDAQSVVAREIPLVVSELAGVVEGRCDLASRRSRYVRLTALKARRDPTNESRVHASIPPVR
jgi:hypothetical protein